MHTLYDFSVPNLNDIPVALSQYRGQVLLIVNTASQCGLTPQYRQLQALQARFHEKGFNVLAFPCNQFAGQEPDDANTISNFCQQNYNVTFPLFAKINVNGKDADPLFVWLKNKAPGLWGSKAIKWNFTKFLVSRTGKVVSRHAPHTRPLALTDDITRLLKSND